MSTKQEQEQERECLIDIIGETVDALIRGERPGAIAFVSLCISCYKDGKYTFDQVRELAERLLQDDEDVQDTGEQETQAIMQDKDLMQAINASLHDIEHLNTYSLEESRWMLGLE